MLNLQQRWDRVNNTTHIIHTDDFSIHKVGNIQSLKDCVLVHTEGNLTYIDTDVFTLDEIYQAELGVDTIRTELELT
jgi:Zn-finger protein|tara:strand:+ start:327 stop:557 length:231 start_codon:yes stop_codon:yes gene_type:complete